MPIFLTFVQSEYRIRTRKALILQRHLKSFAKDRICSLLFTKYTSFDLGQVHGNFTQLITGFFVRMGTNTQEVSEYLSFSD